MFQSLVDIVVGLFHFFFVLLKFILKDMFDKNKDKRKTFGKRFQKYVCDNYIEYTIF